MKNVKVLNQIQEIVEAVKKYQGQNIVINNWTNNNNSYSLQAFIDVDVTVIENKVIFEDENNIIEFIINEIENTYIDNIDIFVDAIAETHIIFSYMDRKYSILNLV